MNRLFLLIALFATLTLTWAQPASAQTAEWQAAYNGQTPEERALVKCANRERKKEGLPLLGFGVALHKAARLQARQMRDYNFFNHTDQAGRGPKQRVDLYSANLKNWTYVGENIAAGYDVNWACNALVQSTDHRKNMVNPYWTKIGTGYASGGGTYGVYFVQVFSRP